MATYNLRRFSDADALKRISPQHLLKLLVDHREYFSDRGVVLPEVANVDTFDYEGLVRVFMSPDTDTPPDLSDKLYSVHEMATPEAANMLLEELEGRGFSLNGQADPTPADIAVQAWLFDKDFFERKHAEQFLTQPRSFEYYQTDRDKVPAFKRPSKKQEQALTEELDNWFESKKRGRGARVFVYEKPDGIWFMVQHGELWKREGTLNAGKPGSVHYRPGKHDILGYDPRLGELRIHACSTKETELYRTRFGLHFFGDENFFPGKGKYTLEPLKTDGAMSLNCDDIQGMEWIRLKEIKYYWGGPFNKVETIAADDLFAAWEQDGRGGVRPKGRIGRASFLVKFADSKTPRTVVIRPSNIAKYTRDDDAAVLEKFLTKRGFILVKNGEQSEEHEEEAAATLASV